MANIQAAATNATSLANTIKSYYDRLLLEVLDPNAVYFQFGQKKPLPKNEGTSIIWNRSTRLALGFTLSEGVPISTANALSTTTVSALIQQFGGFTAISDLVDLTSITEPMRMAAERLGVQAAETIDAVIRQSVVEHVSLTNSSAHSFGKTSTVLYEYWGLTSTSRDVVSSLNVIAVSDVRQCAYSLKKLNVAPYEGNDYVAVIHPEISEDLVGDATFINWHQYAGNEDAIKNLYNGEIGKIYGTRFVESTLAPISAGSNSGGAASTMAYGTYIFGRGFYGVSELDGGIKTYVATGASKSDPLNQETTYGWKANFACQILNTSAGLVLWTGSGQTTAAVGDFQYASPTAY